MFTSLLKVAAAACLFQLASAGVVVRDEEALIDTDDSLTGEASRPGQVRLDWSDVASLQSATYKGSNYGCKCYVGQSCWPAANKWNQLNNTVGGRLQAHIPPGAVCHNTFQGPFGNVSTYNAAACADAQANFGDEAWTVAKPAAALWTYFTNETCRATTNPTSPCTLGYYGIYVIAATTREHIKAGVDFARKNNIRLIVRNTGHDFIGRSTGWGALIINTHSFKEVTWINAYPGAGTYHGSAVKIGAGVQGGEILTQGHARSPPLVVVTGECATVGIAGGFIQGGGHGPWSTLKGMSVDNVLAFEVLTASGEFTTADANTNADLFWGLKGGGPASFAVILSVTMKTFPDVISSGATLYINGTYPSWTGGMDLFHKYANHFVDNGLYVYYEMAPFSIRVRPWVAIGKTQAQLQAILQPFLDELTTAGVVFEFMIKSYPTFFDLYNDLFEAEQAAQTALTGGWLFNHDDIANRRSQMVTAFQTVIFPRADLVGIMIGHLFNPGYNVPVADNAAHPAWRNATDFIITVLPVSETASLAVKADMQNVLTNTMDAALRGASNSGATYVNEADPYQPNWQTNFWGSSYPRLKTLRSKWDPKGIFYAIATPGTESWEVIEDGTRLCKKL
ncbi:hypothetical protein B0H63DRAFT_558417 [Podospora didyma]|uniref:FAD-binding PCMH-type domain-containing protein n=1 Tax=Podospora didyma TaxID=330526 RepID=A0AAE0U0X6_9PEZI|nr:hypothetical protein B0H63DRAFT_558417 [Podospora didyma]